MSQKRKKEIVLPALRGIMGDWVYYSCLMSIDEIAMRVSYADEIHNNKKLSDMIQRRLKAVRSEQISEYIRTQMSVSLIHWLWRHMADSPTGVQLKTCEVQKEKNLLEVYRKKPSTRLVFYP